MNRLVKISMIAVGFILVGYGVYDLITPQTSEGVQTLNSEIKNGNDTYLTIVLGLVAVVLGAVIGKRYK